MSRIKSRTVVLASIFIFALILRLFYLYQIKDTPVLGFYTADAQYHDKFALRILSGDFQFRESVYLNSLYSFFLAAVYKVAGHSLLAVGLCQAVIDSTTAILLFFITFGITKKEFAGLVASFIYASYGIAIFYTGLMLETTLATFLLTGFVFLLLRIPDGRSGRVLPLSAGFVLGLAALLRANIILILPFMAAWILLRKKEMAAKAAITVLLITVGAVVAILPFSIRNYSIAGVFSPFPVNGGINFYIGNNPEAAGIYMPLEGISNSPVYQARQSVAKASSESGKALSPSQASRYWFAKGVKFALEYPARYIKLMGTKILLFFNKEEVPANENFYLCKEFAPILKMPLFSFYVVAPFAMTGVVLALFRRDRRLYPVIIVILAYAFSVVLFFIESRYRFPCMPLVIVMAAYCLSNIRPMALALPALGLSFLVVGVDIPIPGASTNLSANYNNLGVSYYGKGEFKKAGDEYRKALAIKPNHAESWNNLAAVYYKLGDKDNAIKFYNTAIGIDPGFAQAYYGLANLYSDTGEEVKAVILYKKSIEHDPDFMEAYNNLGCLYSDAGKIEDAIAIFEKAIETDGRYSMTYNNLGVVYARMGDKKKASALFKKAIELNPNFKDARNNLLKIQTGGR